MMLIPIVLAILLVGCLLIFREQILFSIGDFLIVREKPGSSDIIHVIAGPDYRTAYAIQLYKQGVARFIFFTGGWCNEHQINHSEHGKQLAIDAGVPESVIFTDQAEIDSTYAEANRLKVWINHSSQPVRSVIVVTDPFHTRRARWAYDKVFQGQIAIQMAPVPFELTPYDRRWWAFPGSLQMVKIEYIKTVFYYARYQFSWGRVQEWLATFDRY